MIIVIVIVSSIHWYMSQSDSARLADDFLGGGASARPPKPIHTCICTYIYIYIYIERESYIYIYVERDTIYIYI